MTASKVKRKLTTIFCADVQSYSALMAEDEAQTLGRLQRYRAIMGDLFARHEGRKVNTWGDAVIAEFSSVVEAVRCAVEIQDAIGAENRALPSEQQMWFRIGINLGDVMEDGGDLYGDGVNVAARLEALAEPGGIMVSQTVHDLTHRQLAFAYDYAGEQQVKGLDAPIAGYRVRMTGRNDPLSTEPRPPRRAPAERDPTRRTDHANTPGLAGRLLRIQDWYLDQPRAVRMPVAVIAILATINVLTTGMANLWFVYPSIPFVLILVFHFFTRNARS